jgi:hypothetical protein
MCMCIRTHFYKDTRLLPWEIIFGLPGLRIDDGMVARNFENSITTSST